MLHTQYHKGQQQTGAYKDNIRFLPKAIGDLLLDYLPLMPRHFFGEKVARVIWQPGLIGSRSLPCSAFR